MIKYSFKFCFVDFFSKMMRVRSDKKSLTSLNCLTDMEVFIVNTVLTRKDKQHSGPFLLNEGSLGIFHAQLSSRRTLLFNFRKFRSGGNEWRTSHTNSGLRGRLHFVFGVSLDRHCHFCIRGCILLRCLPRFTMWCW
jgi:hypothetical protein